MTMLVDVVIEILPHGKGLPLPAYASELAAGADLHAAIAEEAPIDLAPMQRTLVPTGVRLAVPQGFEAQVRPRSGLALRHGVTVLNTPGTIDADFRGEVGVVLINMGATLFTIERGSRIAQLVIAPVARAVIRQGPVDPADTRRGAGGFGSTGTGAAGADPGRASTTEVAAERGTHKR